MAQFKIGGHMMTDKQKSVAQQAAACELKALRRAMSDKHKPLSQPKFAELLGVGRDIVCAVEIGIKRLTPNIARRIRACTGCMIFSVDEKIRAPGWENLPLRDIDGRPYVPASYRNWCHFKANVGIAGCNGVGKFFGDAIEILSAALRRADEGAPMERRNSKLIALWCKISELLLDLLAKPALAAEAGRELVSRFGEKEMGNFSTFLRCLSDVSSLAQFDSIVGNSWPVLPCEGEVG
jgi:hypothetical protein